MNRNTQLAKHPEAHIERTRERPVVTPLVDVYENDDELLLIADVPGATKDGINIELHEGRLTIEGKRGEEPPSGASFAEHRPCDYVRAFSVPRGIDASKVQAELSAGVLHLHLPKAEAVKPRRIEVKAK
jgi:HSP20 family protein